MATMTFQINDAAAGTTNPAVWVTITEAENGTLTFQISQEGGIVGDLRGIFFDLADESILSTLKVYATSTDIRIGDDSIKDLGDGANMNGLLGSDKGYDVGIEIGTSGIGKDDIRSYFFTLASTARGLSLDDFLHVDFAARLTSVGVLTGSRADSSKLLELTSEAVQLDNTDTVVFENNAVTGNVLKDVVLAGNTFITEWAGGAVGSQVALESEGDLIATLQLKADGSYVLDASMADELSAGESIVYNLAYTARNQDEATSWSSDNAYFTVVVHGVNDGPVAEDDEGGVVLENASVTGNVLLNDSDVDRLDVLKVYAVGDTLMDEDGAIRVTLASGAVVIMNADGSYSYETNGAFNELTDGQIAHDSFTYTIADGHGGFDTATVNFEIHGIGDAPQDPPPPENPDSDNPLQDLFPPMLQDISNVVLYLDDGDSTTDILKVKLQPEGLSLNDVDDLNIFDFIEDYRDLLGGNDQLVGISVHAGQEYPNNASADLTASGEGPFYFLLDNETPTIEAIGSRDGKGWTFDWSNDDVPLTDQAIATGITYDLLVKQADMVFTDLQNGSWA